MLICAIPDESAKAIIPVIDPKSRIEEPWPVSSTGKITSVSRPLELLRVQGFELVRAINSSTERAVFLSRTDCRRTLKARREFRHRRRALPPGGFERESVS